MKHQINSFKVAFEGIYYVINHESHMRFHMVAGGYAVVFGLFYNFTLTQWAILTLLISLILTLEIINTGLERLCDLTTTDYNPTVKIIKDVAAGTVLVACIGACVIGWLFYFNLPVLYGVINYFSTHILSLILLLFSVPLTIIFVIFGPLGIKNSLLKANRKNHTNNRRN